MKKIAFIAVASLLSFSAFATETDSAGYQFTIIKENPVTSIKNQNRSSTCWAFSGNALLESELLRQGKDSTDLSEMFVVHHSYTDKAEKYVRLHGSLNFAPGGSFEDVLFTFKNYGAIPEEVMNGLNYGEKMHVHNEMDDVAKAYIDAIIAQKKLSTAWKKGFSSIIDSYLGELPQSFSYKGKTYTPQSYAASLGLDADNYVSLTSFTHHPFYEPFVIEIPDNWRWANSYNLPVDEMMSTIEQAVMNGYTVAWAADVSEKGFTRNGIGVIPDTNENEMSGSDQARWLGLTQKEKDDEIKKIVESPCKEITATQQDRQEAFDNYQTTDDHGMLIYGIAKDQTGKKYYMVKNSWGTNNKYKGTWYVSEPFVRYKTISVVVNKNAIDKNLRKSLKLN